MFQLITTVLQLYRVIIIVRVLLSWIPHNEFHPVIQWIYRLTEPLLAPIRAILPTRQLGIDLSPLVLLLAMSFLQRLLLSLIFSY